MTNEKQVIQKELIDIAPLLAKLDRPQKGFAPEGYFNIVETQILSQLNLVTMENQNVQNVPDQYFESVEEDILVQLEFYKQELKMVKLKKASKQYMYGIAASLAFVLVSLVAFNFYNQSESPEIAAVSQEEYIQYISDHIDEFDINLLIEQDLLNDQVLRNISYTDLNSEIDESILNETEIILK